MNGPGRKAAAADEVPEGSGSARAPARAWAVSGFVVFVCLTLFAVDGWRSWRLYKQEIAEAQQRLDNAARLLAGQTHAALSLADTLLLTTARSMESAASDPLAKPRLHDFLLTALQRDPWLQAVAVYDETGKAVLSSAALPPAALDPAFLRRHAAQPLDTLDLDRMAKAAHTDAYLILSRRWNKPDGSFAGVVAAQGDPAYFQRLPTLDRERQGLASLFREDGVLLLRQPAGADSARSLPADGLLFSRYLPQASSGSFRAESGPGDQARFVSYLRLDAYPVVAAATLPVAEVLAGWRSDALQHLAVVTVLALVFVLMGQRLLCHTLRSVAAERGLAEQHAFQLSVQNSLSGRLAVLGSGGVVIAVNHAWQAFIAGRGGLEAPCGHNYLETCIEAEGIRAGVDAAAVRAGIRGVLLRAQVEYEVEYPVADAHGMQWFRMHVTTLRGAQQGAVIIHENISKLKQAQSQLREEERFLRLLSEVMPGMVAYWTRDLQCRFSNSAYRAWFGKSNEEMLETSLRDLLGEALSQQNEPAILAALNGETQRFERTLVNARGEQGYKWVHYLPDMEGGQVRGFFVLVSDVTELKLGQIKLEQLNETLNMRTRQAEAANLAKSQFLANMSHEIRTPLHTILGYARLLRKQLGPEQESKIQIIENSGSQLLQLIEGILTFSSGESREPAIYPEAVALQALRDKLQSIGEIAAMGRRNVFLIEVAADLPAVLALDEQHLLQVLQNLIANACKFTEHGVVRLVISREASRPGEETWHDVRFAVEDSGIGIAPEHHQHIFEAFGRVVGGQRLGGVGLGLAIAQQLVKAMGGLIEVDSALGVGSRFHFCLRLKEVPIFESSMPAPARDNIIGHSPPRRRILVADDIEGNRQFLNLLLTMWGFEVLEAADGTEALALCADAGQHIDVVLTDQYMPHMGGWAFLRALRDKEALTHPARPLPVVLLSAAVSNRPADFPEDMDFDQVLMKPLDEIKLANWLEKVLGLHWLRAAGSPQPAASAPLVFPPLAEHERIQLMLNLGQVIAIRRWAEALKAEQPAYGVFAARVMQLCAEVNLEQLKLLLAEWER